MNLDTVINSVVKLPPSPQILPKLQKLLRDENSGIEDIIGLLKVDAAMTAQVVRLSNSAYFGSASPSQSLDEAINRLGFKEVYKIVSMAAMGPILGESIPLYQLEKGELLAESIACAAMMTELAAIDVKVNLDTAYTAGLLHAIGKVVINQYYRKRGLQIYDAEAGEMMTPEMERTLLGFDHAEAGAALLSKWNFAEDIVQPLRYQWVPLKAPSHHANACMLHLSLKASHVLKMGEVPKVADLEVDFAVLKYLHLDEAIVEDCCHLAASQLAALNEIVAWRKK